MSESSRETTGSGSRTGQMTAVMRAVAPTGPKVLRIGLVRGGKVIEERIVRKRTDVTVGPNERSTFVLRAGSVRSTFKLFELVGDEYCLNFLDDMTGRVALPTGVTDLEVLRGQARRADEGGHQVRLTDEARGKVVVGDTTFLFQFVAPPPIQPRPQLPVSVITGATSIDWTTTMIAAFSFLVHFLAIGAMYSDWLDQEFDYDQEVKSLIESVTSLPAPPPLEEQKPEEKEDESKAEQPEKKVEKQQAKKKDAGDPKQKMTAEEAATLTNELNAALELQLLGVQSTGPATADVLRSSEVPTSALDKAAASGVGVSTGASGLNIGKVGGAVRPGSSGGGLASLGSSEKAGGSGSGTAAKVEGPKGSASVGGANVTGGAVSGASRAVARMRAAFRRCYNVGLASNPDISGKINLKIRVGPGGEVTGVAASTSGNIPGSVTECVKARARQARFSPPEGGGTAVVAVPVSFVKQ